MDRAGIGKALGVAVAAFTIAAAGCSSANHQNGVVIVFLQGETRAFENRVISVNGTRMEPPRVSPQATLEHGSEVSVTAVGLCTRSRETFLHEPLRITVQTGDGEPVTHEVERVGCALNPDTEARKYNQEDNYLWLDADGTLNADFGSSAQVYASCYTDGFEPRCDEESLAP